MRAGSKGGRVVRYCAAIAAAAATTYKAMETDKKLNRHLNKSLWNETNKWRVDWVSAARVDLQ